MGTLTLNAQGHSDALFVFQIGSTLTTASNSAVTLINGGDQCNIFFQVGTSATLGTTTAFEGNILAADSITLNNSANVVSGRVLAETGVVTLDTNNVSCVNCTIVNAPAGKFGPAAVPEPTTLALLASFGMAGAGFLRRRR